MGLGEVEVDQGGTLAGDTQTLSHRVDTHTLTPNRVPWTPGHIGHTSHPPGDLQSHPSPAGSSLEEAALHTSSRTHSAHPLTAEPSPKSQTS